MLSADALRSFLFILLTAALFVMLLYKYNDTTKKIFAVALTLLMLVDMWDVAKRYLNDDMFQPKAKTTTIAVTDADRQIKAMAGDDPHYRVFNLTDPNGPFNEAFTSYKHNSIGGYSPAKLARYQDLIERHLANLNMNVISMLNTRFFITPDGVQENHRAFGNCWLVDNIEWVGNAKEEIAAIEHVDTVTAYIDKMWIKDVNNPEQYNNSAEGTIELTEYRNPGNIVYHSSCEAPKMAVFSEVYYKTWKAYIDGKEVTPIRANYVLRALPIPAGEHTIEFKCVDELMIESHKWSLYMSVLVGFVIAGLIGFGIYRIVKREMEKKKE